MIVKNASEVLAPGGMFSFTYAFAGIENDYWENFFDENGFDKSCLVKRKNNLMAKENAFINLISKNF